MAQLAHPEYIAVHIGNATPARPRGRSSWVALAAWAAGFSLCCAVVILGRV
jgi:hypothetical protein